VSDSARLVKCALHVHSSWSDGEFTLTELRDVFIAEGVSIVAMADHDYAFSQESLVQYVGACAAASDANILFVPGLEFECDDRMHIVGFGVASAAGTSQPEEVIAHIERCGGVSVIAHPRDAHFAWIRTFVTLPMGLEVWNSKYDGRYAPRPRTFALFHDLRQRRPDLHAFYGQDLHWRTQYRGLITWIRVRDLSQAAVLEALAHGAFHGEGGRWTMPSDGGLDEATLTAMDAANARSQRFRTLVRRVKAALGGVVRLLPPSVATTLLVGRQAAAPSEPARRVPGRAG
jgi:hypothetical protein